MKEYFYDFTMDGENRGHSYLSIDSKRLLSVTRFSVEKEYVLTNAFLLRLRGQKVVGCKHGER